MLIHFRTLLDLRATRQCARPTPEASETLAGGLPFPRPTGQFLLAVLAFGEPFTLQHLISFSLVWSGIAIYLLEVRRGAKACLPPAPRGDNTSAQSLDESATI